MNRTHGTLWALDFDGTLSNLVPDRSSAVLDPDCRDLLAALSEDPAQVVAVVSSRALADLEPRIPFDNVLLAGSSGLEWRLPHGPNLRPTPHTRERAARERERVLAALEPVRQIPGVAIEDKTWSLAVHFREVVANFRPHVVVELEHLRVALGLSLYFGPTVAEIQLIEEVSKVTATRTLARLCERQFRNPPLVYAGDDQNDLQAMRWVLERKGIVYVVGDRITVKGAQVVIDPSELARAMRRRFMPELEYRLDH